jgi:hypothetical protein
MPQFQGSLVGIQQSYNWSVAHSRDVSAARDKAITSAHERFDAAVPARV